MNLLQTLARVSSMTLVSRILGFARDAIIARAFAADGAAWTGLKVDGGMVANATLMQFHADILGVPVIRPTVSETSALGAAYVAGLAVGFWSGIGELSELWSKDREWQPGMDDAKRERLFNGWKKAVTRTFDWTDDDRR